mgnify:CR=1 FL=1
MNYECKVNAPEGFNPKNTEQDIEVLRPLFNAFDELDYQFNKYDNATKELISHNRDLNTKSFYDYYRGAEEVEWKTLARWRYQNDEVYNRFMFWRFVNSMN